MRNRRFDAKLSFRGGVGCCHASDRHAIRRAAASVAFRGGDRSCSICDALRNRI
jgi:hypothetical protein